MAKEKAIVVAKPAPDALVVRTVQPMQQRVAVLVIKTVKDYENTAVMITQIDALLDGPELTERKKIKDQARATWESAHKHWKTPYDQLDGMKRDLLAKRSIFEAAAERRRQLQIEENNAKEKQRQIEDAKKVATQLRKSGDREAAREVVELAKTTPVSTAPPPPLPKPAGFVSTTVVEWEVENEDEVPDPYWLLDRKSIGNQVRNLGLAHGIKGIRAWEQPKQHTRVPSNDL